MGSLAAQLPLSVVTISKSGSDSTLRATGESLREIALAIEWIVVVGDDPETVDLSRFPPPNLVIGFSSDGIYTAMNAGLAAASRDYVYFLNGGDIFAASDKLEQIMMALTESGKKWFVGSVKLAGKRKVLDGPVIVEKRQNCAFADGRMPPQPASLYLRSELLRQGGLNAELGIAADYELALRFAQLSPPVTSSEILAVMAPGGISDTHRFRALKEMRAARRRVRRDHRGSWSRSGVTWLTLKAYASAVCVLIWRRARRESSSKLSPGTG